MKRALGIFLVCTLIITLLCIPVQAEEISVYINGEKLEFDVPPILLNDRTLVPLRAIFEALGADVYWDDVSETAMGNRCGVKVSVTVDSADATINGKAYELDQPAVLIEGRTLVPLRFISEAYGCEVEWEEETQTVRITANEAFAAFHVTSAMFMDRGTWTYSGDMLQGKTTGLAEGQKSEDISKDAIAQVTIVDPGKYNLWVRDRDYATNQPGARFFNIAVDGVRQDKLLGVHGEEGFRWTFVSTLDLSEGVHTFALQDTSCFFPRCEGFFLTKDLNYTPSEDPEELSKMAVPVSPLDGLPMSIYPQWSKGEMQTLNTVSISNDQVSVTFYEGTGRRGTLVQNEIKVKNGTDWVTVKDRSEELGFLMLRAENSSYVGYAGSTSTEAEGITAKQTVAIDGKTVETNVDNLYSTGYPTWFIPKSVEKISDTEVRLHFERQNETDLTVTYSFDDVSIDPKVTLSASFGKPGAYSFLLYSGDDIKDGSYEQVTAPFLYVKKRVPQDATMVPACYMFTPMATFTVKTGENTFLTKGIAMDPESVPRAVPYPETSAYCLTLRTPSGNLRGQFAAPQFGTENCLFEAGDTYTVSYRIINSLTDWYETYTHVCMDIYDDTDVRENYYGSLNDAIYNIDELMLDDIYGGWDTKNMGWYNMEAKGVSSQSNFMTAVQRYLLTGNEEMLEKRAIPTIANLLSRSSSHFCRRDIETTYTDAPTVLAENPTLGNAAVLEGLYEMSQGRMPYLLNTAVNKSSIASDITGITTQYAYYRMTGEDKYLENMKAQTDQYIEKTFDPEGEYLNGYFDQAFVFGDYLPKVASFLYTYEATGEKKYLDAAQKAAELLVTSTWTTGYHNGYATSDYIIDPAATEAMHTIHSDKAEQSNWFYHDMTQWRLGYPFGVYGKTKDNPKKIPAETVAGWVPTITGFGTEHPVTAAHGNAITMNTWAAFLEKIAMYTGDEFLNVQARNAIIGRFMNYPGYYQDRYITHQQKADYPYEGPDYSLIYWHHIPVFQSMLEDYLFTSVQAKSKGAIEIPALYQHGYAYFLTKQYGHRPGTFYGEEGFWPWLQKGVIYPDSIKVNYIMGRKDGAFAAALVNESSDALTTTVTLGENLPGGTGYSGSGTLYDADGNSSSISVASGKFTVTIPAKGIATVILPMPGLTAPSYALDTIAFTLDNHKTVSDHTNGHGYVIQLTPDKYYAYTYVTDMAKDMKSLTITYTVDGETKQETVTEYPFEFIIKVDSDSAAFTYTLEGLMQDGTKKAMGGGTLAPISYGAETDLTGFASAEPVDWGNTEFVSGKIVNAGASGGVLRLVAMNTDFPFELLKDNLQGCKFGAVLTNQKTGEQKTFVSELTGNEPRENNVVLLVKSTDDVTTQNFKDDWEAQYVLYPPSTKTEEMVLPKVELPEIEEDSNAEELSKPDFDEAFTVDLAGMGVNVQFRGVINLSDIPFDVAEDSLKGIMVRVEVTDTTTGQVQVLENAIVGNEMRSGKTVIKVDFTEEVPEQNFSDSKYKGKMTFYPAQ